MPYISARDGTDLYVKEWGDGRPVVLIHGWPLSADSWDPVALALANAGYRAISYDRRGFGRSEQPWEGYDYDTFADDLAEVLEETDATEDVTLVGFSMGGGEVARYLSRHGSEGIASVALVGSVVPYMLQTDDNPDGVPDKQFDAMLDQIEKDRAAFFATFFKQFFGVGLLTNPVSDDLRHWAWTVAMQAGLKGTLDCVRAFAHTDFRPDLAAFTVPTLVIHGTSDTVVPPAIGRNAAAGISGAQLIEYDGAPHGLFASEQQRLIGDLLAFLGTTTVAEQPATAIDPVTIV